MLFFIVLYKHATRWVFSFFVVVQICRGIEAEFCSVVFSFLCVLYAEDVGFVCLLYSQFHILCLTYLITVFVSLPVRFYSIYISLLWPSAVTCDSLLGALVKQPSPNIASVKYSHISSMQQPKCWLPHFSGHCFAIYSGSWLMRKLFSTQSQSSKVISHGGYKCSRKVQKRSVSKVQKRLASYGAVLFCTVVVRLKFITAVTGFIFVTICRRSYAGAWPSMLSA